MKKRMSLILVCFLAGLTSVFAQTDFSSLVDASEGVSVSFVNDSALPWEMVDGSVVSPSFSTSKTTTIICDIEAEKDVEVVVDYTVATYSSYGDRFIINRDDITMCSDYSSSSYVEKTSTCSFYAQSGTHRLTFSFYNYYGQSKSYVKINSIDIKTVDSKNINVYLSAPGTLGTEVLAQASSLPTVRYLKVSGALNTDDWTILKQMTGLRSLDMEDAAVTEIPEYAFGNLNRYVFPKTLKKIGNNALRNCYLGGELILPEGLEEIGEYAFYTNGISSCKLPSTVTTIGKYAFYENNRLKSFAFNSNITTIPAYCFYNCDILSEVSDIESVKVLGEYCFAYCNKLKAFNGAKTTTINYDAFYSTGIEEIDLSEVTYVGTYAFYNTKLKNVSLPKITTLDTYAFYNCDSLKSVSLSDKLSSIGNSAFNDCNALATVVLGASVSSIGTYAFSNCPKITKVYCNAPTPPQVNTSYTPFPSSIYSIATLYVPEYAKVTYKLDSYWSKFYTVEDNPNEVTDVTVSNTLELASGARIPSTANLTLNGTSGRLTVNGSAPQVVQNFVAYYSNGSNSSLISRCPNMSSTSSEARYYMNSGYWYFVCMPFDVKVSEITNTVGAAFVIRYYDGASRAANTTTSGNWKDVDADATLKAGKGYIFRVNKSSGYMVLPATEETHNRIFTSEAIETPLETYASETPANANWNLVGNPYPSFYDIYRMDYSAPITVWNVSNSTYTAYSVADDDLALLPYQAFFVQKPDAVSSISFDPLGRQHSTTISHDSSVKARIAKSTERRLINLTLSNGVSNDATRIVVNPMIEDDYNLDCDAAKMFSYETTPQLYTIHADECYAINEGKHESGEIKIGMWFPEYGTYTLEATKADCGYELYDNGQLVTLPYTFDANSGTDESRFVMLLKSAEATTIGNIAQSAEKSAQMFDLTGRRINNAAKKGIYIINNKKVIK